MIIFRTCKHLPLEEARSTSFINCSVFSNSTDLEKLRQVPIQYQATLFRSALRLYGTFGWKYIFAEEDILPFAMRFVTLLLEYFSSFVEVVLCAATAHAEMSLRTDYVCENNQMVSG